MGTDKHSEYVIFLFFLEATNVTRTLINVTFICTLSVLLLQLLRSYVSCLSCCFNCYVHMYLVCLVASTVTFIYTLPVLLLQLLRSYVPCLSCCFNYYVHMYLACLVASTVTFICTLPVLLLQLRILFKHSAPNHVISHIRDNVRIIRQPGNLRKDNREYNACSTNAHEFEVE
jgi:hypothetical protein